MAQVAQGITQTLDELRSEFSSFCERWDWGVRSLVFQANAFAQPVGLAAGLLYETDQYVSGSVKVLSWGSWLGFGWVGVSA